MILAIIIIAIIIFIDLFAFAACKAAAFADDFFNSR